LPDSFLLRGQIADERIRAQSSKFAPACRRVPLSAKTEAAPPLQPNWVARWGERGLRGHSPFRATIRISDLEELIPSSGE
jgi:hypothetical protein